MIRIINIITFLILNTVVFAQVDSISTVNSSTSTILPKDTQIVSPEKKDSSMDTLKKARVQSAKEIKKDTISKAKEKHEHITKDTTTVQVKKSTGLNIDLDTKKIESIISFGKVFWSILFMVIGYILIRLISKTIDLISEKSANYRITLKGFIPIIRILGWITIIYVIIAGIIQPPQATLIAVSASAGIAVGFASQDILKNIFGGIMILLDRPFMVGDKIEAGSHYGEVVKIGLRSTRIVSPDDSLVTIPNSELMNQSVSNSNAGEPNCQVVAEIYLPIDIDTEKARSIAIEAAQVSKYIYLNKLITVLFFNEVRERRSYLKMRLKAYVMDIRYEFVFKSEMTEVVVRELIKQGVLKPEEVF
ncbi:mechanosensitive ion channel family protein [Bacteroidota bacterium]